MFVVGPESAGAHPGPACYRKGKKKYFFLYSYVSDRNAHIRDSLLV